MDVEGWLWAIGIVGFILFILAIVWKPSRVAIGVILVLLGIIGIIAVGFLGIGFVVGVPMLFVGVIFMVTGLRTKRQPVEVRIEQNEQPKTGEYIQPQELRAREVKILAEGQTEISVEYLAEREQDLRSDLETLQTRTEMNSIPAALLEEKRIQLQKQLLDVVLEKEKLVKKLEASPYPAGITKSLLRHNVPVEETNPVAMPIKCPVCHTKFSIRWPKQWLMGYSTHSADGKAVYLRKTPEGRFEVDVVCPKGHPLHVPWRWEQ